MLHVKHVKDVNQLGRSIGGSAGVLYTDSRRAGEAVVAMLDTPKTAPDNLRPLWVAHYKILHGRLYDGPMQHVRIKGSPIIEGAIIAVHIFDRTFKPEEWENYDGR